MKTYLPAAIVYTLIAVQFRCTEPDQVNPRVEKDSLTAVSEACLADGILKKQAYAIVYPIIDEEDFQIAIADTVRMGEVFEAWMPYICDGLPDSLKVAGLELVLDYYDKTIVSEDSNRVAAVELTNVKYLSENLTADPRNGNGVTTVAVDISPWEARPGTYIIRSQEDWEQFSERHSATIKEEPNFDEVTLVGIKRIIGGCWPGGHATYRELLETGEGNFKLKVTTKFYGLCQVGYIKWAWMKIPHLKETDGFDVEFVDIYISREGN